MAQYITSKENEKIKKAVKLSQSSSFRKNESLFYAPSLKVVKDLLQAGFCADTVFCIEKHQEKFSKLQNKLYVVSPNVGDKLAGGKTNDGVWAIFKMPDNPGKDFFSCKKILALQGVQDPGNVGAIMRTALALGYKSVLADKDCADEYSPKVIRSSMTASVKLNVKRVDNLSNYIKALNSMGFATVAACLEEAQELGSVKIPQKFVLFIGNEGSGLGSDIIENSDFKIKIPMDGEIESLNAAVSRRILMWELGK
jgi:TrmH family RNA methyltransferase